MPPKILKTPVLQTVSFAKWRLPKGVGGEGESDKGGRRGEEREGRRVAGPGSYIDCFRTPLHLLGNVAREFPWVFPHGGYFSLWKPVLYREVVESQVEYPMMQWGWFVMTSEDNRQYHDHARHCAEQ
jgi:hypothetical protein